MEKLQRGFAVMAPEKRSEIASKGGIAAHVKGTAHEFTREEAQAAGKRGGDSISRDREHMSRIGREGGKARAANIYLRQQQDNISKVLSGK